MHLHPDAIAAAAGRISREWGESGYYVEKVEAARFSPDYYSAAVMHVVHSDGSRFTVAADRWGNAVECGKPGAYGLPCHEAPGRCEHSAAA